MAKQAAVVVIEVGFDYSCLSTPVAAQAPSTTDHVWERLRRTFEEVFVIGQDLVAVKVGLPHGQFIRWVVAEFGWTDRLAQSFMAVAERFGTKTEIISDLAIQPTATYLLAAPSVPDAAREIALQRAEAGERITGKVARKVLAQVRKKERRKPKHVPREFLRRQLQVTLAWCRERWNEKERADLARELREFAEELEREGMKKA